MTVRGGIISVRDTDRPDEWTSYRMLPPADGQEYALVTLDDFSNDQLVVQIAIGPPARLSTQRRGLADCMAFQRWRVSGLT